VLFVTHDVDEALFLADRIIVLSAKPARVVRSVRVDATRPREMERDPRLQDMRRQLLALFQSIDTHQAEERK
jgi:NitT/TauT family transport system ATP-binding protein